MVGLGEKRASHPKNRQRLLVTEADISDTPNPRGGPMNAPCSRRLARRVVLLTLLTAACGEPTTRPASSRSSPSFAMRAAATCPTAAAVTVSDEAGLLAALAAANPGDVIGINGTIEVTADLVIAKDDITLTCASPGSGLTVKTGATVFSLVTVVAKRVAVERLVLDGSHALNDPYYAFNNGVTTFAEAVRLSNNQVTCSPRDCAFFVGVRDAVVADNYFESAGSVTGVHLQGNGVTRPTDGSRVERNTIVAVSPSTNPAFGGIRPRDGSNVVVSNNVVIGPWANSVSPIELTQSVVEGNRLEGAAVYGVRFFGMSDNVLRNNRITAAGSAGVFAFRACRNVFVGNNLQGNADNLGLIFSLTTGANTLVGNQNVVVDLGSFDCDGDGVADPNIITGRGAVNLGGTISDAVVTANGLR